MKNLSTEKPGFGLINIPRRVKNITIRAVVQKELAAHYLLWDGDINSNDKKVLKPVPKALVTVNGDRITMPEWLAWERGFLG